MTCECKVITRPSPERIEREKKRRAVPKRNVFFFNFGIKAKLVQEYEAEETEFCLIQIICQVFSKERKGSTGFIRDKRPINANLRECFIQ